MRTLFFHVLVLAAVASCNDSANTAIVDATVADQQAADAASGGPAVTILVDNYEADPSLRSGWGYACLVTGLSSTLLFDTGMDTTTLLYNMDKLSVEPQAVEHVMISHDHTDHIVGLEPFLEQAPQSQVHLLASFSTSLKQMATQKSAKVIEIDSPDPVRLFDKVHSLGAMPGDYMGMLTPEQSLAIETPRGLVIVTGCAHPGIVEIVTQAKEKLQQEILLVMGGFHLVSTTADEISSIVDELYQMGVKYVGPTHCTGDVARASFKEKFKERFLDLGTGSVVAIDELGL